MCSSRAGATVCLRLGNRMRHTLAALTHPTTSAALLGVLFVARVLFKFAEQQGSKVKTVYLAAGTLKVRELLMATTGALL